MGGQHKLINHVLGGGGADEGHFCLPFVITLESGEDQNVLDVKALCEGTLSLPLYYSEAHVRNWRSKGHFAPLMRPTKFPEIPVSLERNTELFRHPVL